MHAQPYRYVQCSYILVYICTHEHNSPHTMYLHTLLAVCLQFSPCQASEGRECGSRGTLTLLWRQWPLLRHTPRHRRTTRTSDSLGFLAPPPPLVVLFFAQCVCVCARMHEHCMYACTHIKQHMHAYIQMHVCM